MKKIVFVVLGLLTAITILAISVVRTRAVSPLPVVKPGAEKVDYFLVYPGILPDHFLYPVKMIRDRIWLFLTTDYLRRFELLILFGDKRLGAGRALIEGNKVDLGITTITKAEKYLERAQAQLAIVKNKKKEASQSEAKEKIEKSLRKHQEVIEELREKLSDEDKRKLDGAQQLNQRLRERLQKENP